MNVIRFLQRKTESSFFYDYKTVQQALRFMRSHGCREIPVVNQDGFYLGTIDEGDFLWHMIDYGGYEQVKENKIGSFVRKGNVPAVKITATDDELRNAALCSSFVPIVDDRGVFVGIVARRDIIQYLAEQIRTSPTMVTA